MIAGVTVGLTIIPQGIAYAGIAGLPPQYGLYSAIMGCFAYIFFGSTKDINIGPTAIMALMTKKYTQHSPEYTVLLTFITGCIVLACGVLQLGFLIDFISIPVIAGFTSSAAITIASSQCKSLLGLKVPPGEKSHTHAGISDYYIDIFNHWDTIRWQDATLGLVCCVIILALRALNRTGWFKPLTPESSSWVQAQTNKLPARTLRVLDKFVWFICTARNALVVISCLTLSAILDPDIEVCMEDRYNCTFTLTGIIHSGMPTFQLPPFSVAANTSILAAYDDEEVPLSVMVSRLGSGIVVVPIIAILDAVAIATAFADGKPVDASQEMVAVGVSNIFGSFVQSIPITSSLSRASVNLNSGVKTQMNGLYTGTLVILCLAFLMPYCAFIPKATLASVIMTAICFSVEHHIVRPMWHQSKIDLVPGLITFVVGLFYELEMGIFTGMGVHIAIVLYSIARPRVSVEILKVPDSEQHYLSITPDRGIVYPSVSYIRTLVSKAGIKQGNSELPVVIDCEHISHADFTAANSFTSMLDDFKARGQPVYWLNPKRKFAATLSSAAGEEFHVISDPRELASYEEDTQEDSAFLAPLPEQEMSEGSEEV